MSQLLTAVMNRKAEFLYLLEELITRESPSHCKSSLDELASFLADQFESRGCSVETLPGNGYGNHLRVTWCPAGRDQKLLPVLLLCHMDTVWEKGTLASMPFKIENDKVYGPGAFDMKGGIAMALLAIDVLKAQGKNPRRPITIILNSDEELGTLSARSLIEQQAKQSQYVIVLEGATPKTYACKTARKGVGMFKIKARGKASHAGVAPEEGVSAIEEIARQIIKLHSWTDLEKGTTVNVGTVRGGSRRNVVADYAEAFVDLRVTTMAEADRMEKLIVGLTPELPGARLEVEGALNRPPMERTPGNTQLYEKARTVAENMGLSLPESSSGGGSDGNFTSALGIPTLDGMGAVGDGAHAAHEHLLLQPTLERVAILAELLLQL